MTSHSSGLTLVEARGQQMRPWIDRLAELRIRVFRDFPYLYDGSLAYERDYLETYAAADSALAVLALDGQRLVGAATALALSDEDRAFGEGLDRAGFERDQVYYFGESMLLPGYRGQGLGVAFIQHREAEARQQGKRFCAFCAVQRPTDHPLRPADYQPLDAFWRRRGFQPAPGVIARMPWKDIDQLGETEKTLQFWTKEIAQQ